MKYMYRAVIEFEVDQPEHLQAILERQKNAEELLRNRNDFEEFHIVSIFEDDGGW